MTSIIRVFISSEMKALHNERVIVSSVLEQCGFDVMMFEKFPAGAQGPKEAYLKEVGDCDVYVGIFWNSYSEPTEREYERAKSDGKECLVYIKRKYASRDKRVQRMINDLANDLVWREFDSAIDLSQQVVKDLVSWMSRTIRKDQEDLGGLRRAKELEEFLGANQNLDAGNIDELEELLSRWSDGTPEGIFDYLADQQDIIELYHGVRSRLIDERIAHVELVAGRCLRERDVLIMPLSTVYDVDQGDLAIRPDRKELIRRLIDRLAATESENRQNVRLLDCKLENNKVVLTVQPTPYRGYMVTNYAVFLEKHIRNFPTLFQSGKGNRDSIEPPPGILPLDRAFAANHVGLSCVLVTADNWLVLQRQQGKNVTFPNAVNLIPSSVWQWRSDVNNPFDAMWDQLERGEMMIPRERVFNELVCIGITRELIRAAKPEMFFYLCVNMRLDELDKLDSFASRESRRHIEIKPVRLPTGGATIETMRSIEQIIFERRDYAPPVHGGLWLFWRAVQNEEIVFDSGRWVPRIFV